MKIKTAELTGAALDWAVAKAVGLKPIINRRLNPVVRTFRGLSSDGYAPSNNWAQCGPLRDKFKIDVMDFSDDSEPYISASYEKNHGMYSVEADSALIAICRAVVSCKLGDEVEVPDELVRSCAS